MKIIATHNKVFHADEVSAVALLKIFVDDDIVVKRVAHNTTDFSAYDMVLDISKKFDGVKFFDHHQNKGGKSSAGLIWEYIGLEKHYPKISKLVKQIDANDVGEIKAMPFEYSNLIRCFNSDDIYNSTLQDSAFDKAVDFAITVFSSLKKAQDELLKAKEIVASSYLFNGNPHIIYLDKFTPHWSSYINGSLTPKIKAVVWKDEHEKNFKIKIAPKQLGSFHLNAKKLPQDNSMEFVHSAGFFAVAKDEETMKRYLQKNLKE
jgi:uncharacterized UPF0160 family protein